MPRNIEELKEIAKNYRHTLSVSIIEDTPFIVEVGAFTVSTDAIEGSTQRAITLSNTAYPEQFSHKALAVIKTCNFKNKHGAKVPIKIYSRGEWYTERLAATESLIKLMEDNPGIWGN